MLNWADKLIHEYTGGRQELKGGRINRIETIRLT